MVPSVPIDSSVLALASVASAGAIALVASALSVRGPVALAIGGAAGLLLYGVGVVPIGFLVVVFVSAIAAALRLVTRSGAPPVHQGESSEPSPKPVPTKLRPIASAESAELSPLAIGFNLATGLSKACLHDPLPPEEQEMLEASRVLSSSYRQERLMLAAFAQDFAISRALGSSQADNAVRRGFLNFWTGLSNHSPEGDQLSRIFWSRCETYGPAATRSEDSNVLDPISLAFAGFLGEENALAQVLGLSMGRVIFDSYSESLLAELESAGLVRRVA